MKEVSHRNSILLEGNLLRDPAFRFDEDEDKNVCDLKIASCRVYNEGLEKEVSYFDVRLYRKELIEAAERLGYKGRRVNLTGRLLEERSYIPAPEGTAVKSRVVVVADTVEYRPDLDNEIL